jgi:hypothetical protein
VDDLNRYVARPIRIADPSLAGLTYTGVLNIEGEDMMLRKLAAVLPIQAKPSTAEILLQKPAPKKPKKVSLVQKLLTLDKPKPQLQGPVRPTPRLLPIEPPQPKPAPAPVPSRPQAALRQGKATS